MTKAQIEKVRFTFSFGGVSMVEWYTVYNKKGMCKISSGLKNPDEMIKSPFYYNDVVIGNNCKEIAYKNFTDWYNGLVFNKYKEDETLPTNIKFEL